MFSTSATGKIVTWFQKNNLNKLFTTFNILNVKAVTPKDVPVKKKSKFPTSNLVTKPETEFSDLPIVIVKATYNNTLCYLTDHKGITATWTSAGIEGFKNSKRGTNYAGKVAAESLAKKANDLGVNKVRLKVRGMGPGRMDAVKALASILDVVSITDTTPIPHNGPRPKKQRRL
ncbi:small ribosomal subunit protein uS11 [Hydra vulgaris]|nr:30S ribosomal protein S11 [Hydra vulgaris]